MGFVQALLLPTADAAIAPHSPDIRYVFGLLVPGVVILLCHASAPLPGDSSAAPSDGTLYLTQVVVNRWALSSKVRPTLGAANHLLDPTTLGSVS